LYLYLLIACVYFRCVATEHAAQRGADIVSLLEARLQDGDANARVVVFELLAAVFAKEVTLWLHVVMVSCLFVMAVKPAAISARMSYWVGADVFNSRPPLFNCLHVFSVQPSVAAPA
jgi:hypothetical protein